MTQLCPPQVARSKMIVWILVPSWYDKDYNGPHCLPFAQRDSSSLWTETFSTLITISRSCCLVKELCDELAISGELAANTLKYYFKFVFFDVSVPFGTHQPSVLFSFSMFWVRLSICHVADGAIMFIVWKSLWNISKCRFKLKFWLSKVLLT